jgi:sulfite exporter TauE/SafE
MGPDHYVPFLALARLRGWSLPRTLAVTAACGLAHVLSSVLLGLVGVALGLGLGQLEAVQDGRGRVAAWLLLGFGMAYTLWGLRRASRGRRHVHWHAHDDGTVHSHVHNHRQEHAHAHLDSPGSRVGPWVLFLVFVFGPCEVLIPQLMIPAAQHSWAGVAALTALFTASTLTTMLAVVTAGYAGLHRLLGPGSERYAPSAAGLAVSACAVLMLLGW